MKLNKEQILEYQQNRPPYLMIDFAEEVIPGESAKGYKDFKEDEFIKKIIPKSRLYIETKITSFKRGVAICEGMGLIQEELVCKAEFNLILPDEIKKYNLKK